MASRWTVVAADYRGSDTITEMAERVLDLAPQGRLALVGFSLGGYIAFEIMRQHASRVQQLALISSSPFADDAGAIKQRKRLIEKAAVDYDRLLVEMGNFVVHDAGPHAAAALQSLFDMGKDLGADEFCRQQSAAMQRLDCRDILSHIRVPTRVLCGSEDAITPVAGNRLVADSIPGATLEIVDRAGHLLPLESPQRVTSFLLRWLEESASAA